MCPKDFEIRQKLCICHKYMTLIVYFVNIGLLAAAHDSGHCGKRKINSLCGLRSTKGNLECTMCSFEKKIPNDIWASKVKNIYIYIYLSTQKIYQRLRSLSSEIYFTCINYIQLSVLELVYRYELLTLIVGNLSIRLF